MAVKVVWQEPALSDKGWLDARHRIGLALTAARRAGRSLQRCILQPLLWRVVVRIDRNSPDVCWAALALHAMGYRPLSQLFKLLSVRYSLQRGAHSRAWEHVARWMCRRDWNVEHDWPRVLDQYCRADNPGTPYAYCGKCDKLGRYADPELRYWPDPPL